MKLISLFTGIGAYERALKNNAIEYDLVKFCEVDKFAVQSYCAIHDASASDNLGDIQAVNPSTLPEVDLVTFSYPCTDLSLAGKQKGFFEDNGDVSRSGLFFSAADIIASCRPKFAISENVASLTLAKFKTEFDLVKSTLEEAGYHNYWTVLNAKDFGLPQHRERMFMVSVREDIDHGFVFPKGHGESGCIADILEPEENVDAKHYLKQSRLEKLIWYNPAKNFEGIVTAGSLETGHQRDRIYSTEGLSGTLTATDYKQPKQIDVRERGGRVQQIAKLDSHRDNPNQYRVYDAEGLSPTLTTMGGGGRQPHIPINGGVRRFTPLECFRLMGFKDEDYQSAKYMTDTCYLIGGLKKCNAKLKAVTEKQRPSDTDTYVCCTISELIDMELLKSNLSTTAIRTNVNIVIERLAQREYVECVTSTTKCFVFMGMRCILTQENDQQTTVIIEQVQKDGMSTESYMKITMESPLPVSKLYIILTLIKLITESKIFGATTVRATMSGHIVAIMHSENSIQMQLSNLTMVSTKSRTSDTELYKQCGNSICVNVLEAIFDELSIQYPKEFV